MRVVDGNNQYAVFKEDNNSVSNILFAETGTAICTNHDEIRVNPVEVLEDYEVINQITVDGNQLNIVNLPEVGEPCEAHHFYNWNGQIVLCRQDHDRTNFTPDQTPNLFSTYRGGDSILGWIPNEEIKYGWKRICDNVTYICIQPHMTVEGLTPDKTPALWNVWTDPNQIVVWKQPAGASDAYNIGDRVHFPTINDPIYESKIDANVWSPTVYPDGWKIV
ncbi:MAG TPA: hypothetical protein VJ991_11295 [Balneolales bacterium]|nr:hypothetical protein [Balneolales bacterium]